MTQVRVKKTINAAPDTVWASVGRPEKIHEWHPAITASPCDGDLRRCVLASGAEVHEKILEQNDHEHFYRYSITDGPLPVKDYQGRISVSPENGGCSLSWEATFEALAPEADVKAMIEGVMAAGIDNVRASFA